MYQNRNFSIYMHPNWKMLFITQRTLWKSHKESCLSTGIYFPHQSRLNQSTTGCHPIDLNARNMPNPADKYVLHIILQTQTDFQ